MNVRDFHHSRVSIPSMSFCQSRWKSWPTHTTSSSEFGTISAEFGTISAGAGSKRGDLRRWQGGSVPHREQGERGSEVP